MNNNRYVDYTLLKANASLKEIEELCNNAKLNNYKSVCVNPCNIKTCKKFLKNSNVLVCTVIGFPLGQNTAETKVFETIDAIKNGADEIDMVINVGKVLDGDFNYIEQEITRIRKVCLDKTLKVIIETCYLNEQQILKLSEICKRTTADYVKTSTGFGTRGASIDDIKLIKSVLSNDLGIKASGGIKTDEFAKELIELGATRIGTSSQLFKNLENDKNKE